MKMLKIELEEALHAKFKGWAFGQGTTMAKAARGLIAAEVDYFPVTVKQLDVAKEVGFDPNNPSGSSPSTKANRAPAAPPFDYGVEPVEEPRHQCALCRESFVQSEMVYHAKTMKWACCECVDKQKNNQ